MTEEKVKKVTLRYIPHQSQKIIHSSTSRWKIATCGRRWGKSLAASADIINKVFSGKYRPEDGIAWIAPSFQVADRGVDATKLICRDVPDLLSWWQSYPKVATFPNGCKCRYLSASNPDSLRGFGFRHVVIDEADYIPDYVWNDVIRPTLADKQGSMIAISTPKRKNSWFHKLYLQGLGDSDYIQSFHFPSSTNPFLPDEEIEQARLSLPQDTFQREWMANWTDGGGEVFKGIEKCVEDGICNCKAPEIIGIDLAKHQDFTVMISICEKCNRVKYIHRWNSVDWDEQISLIKSVYINSVSPKAYIDATGIGDVVSDLVKNQMNVETFHFSNTSKQQLISNLRLSLMTQKIKWSPKLKNSEILKYELESYEVQETKNGSVTYNAPIGSHDDCVIALGLANKGLKSYVSPNVSEFEEEKEMEWEQEEEGFDMGDLNQAFFG